AAALDVPTAGVPTYLVDSPARATGWAEAAATAGRAGTEAAGVAGALGAVAAGAAGSPHSAVTSASVRAGKPLPPRRPCSAAIADLLHFFPSATHFATSALIGPEGAAGVAAGTAVVAGTGAACAATGSPSSAATSESLSVGKLLRPRLACSAAIADLLH